MEPEATARRYEYAIVISAGRVYQTNQSSCCNKIREKRRINMMIIGSEHLDICHACQKPGDCGGKHLMVVPKTAILIL